MLWTASAAWIALFAPTLWWLVISWVSSSYYSHGLLGLALAGIVGYWRHRNNDVDPWDIHIGFVIAAGALFALAGFFTGLNAFKAWGSYILLWCIIARFIDRDLAAVFTPALVIISILTPLPFVAYILSWLQLFTAQWAVYLIKQAFCLSVAMEGPLLSFANGTQLLVGASCSGFKSVIVLLALSVSYTQLAPRSYLVFFGLPLASVLVALLSNAARVCLMLRAAAFEGQEAALWFWDITAGIVFFTSGLVVLGVIGWILTKLSRQPA
ncbi:exosortase/archaeosortase family protein [Elusimicrobiota bacterium]